MAGIISMDESEDDVEMSLYPPGELFRDVRALKFRSTRSSGQL